uniref:ATP synthase F0 subunit 8 n=1 Tax=Satarupa monbeigi TaxID=425086 RepID=UPI002A805016|nr:ATP synthase F0 subunit 8 [Satarupa monbeigi]WNO18670.1 ATP synthase F0 subunit 8 [Satarupa monbeigi]
MPQMMPINWIISFIFFILIFILFNIMNYYIYNIKKKNKSIKKNFTYNLNWKW